MKKLLKTDKISIYESFNPNDYSTGDNIEIYLNNKSISVEIISFDNSTVNWINGSGELGSSNVENIICKNQKIYDEPKRYFYSKGGNFLIPFDEIKSTDKAFLLGYKDVNTGKTNSLWIPKSLIFNEKNRGENIKNVPSNYYLIGSNYFDSGENDYFLKDYINYIESCKKKSSFERYITKIEDSKKFKYDVERVINYFFKKFNINATIENIEFNNVFNENNFDVLVNGKSFQVNGTNGIKDLRMYINNEKNVNKTYFLSPENVKKDTIEGMEIAFKICEFLNLNTIDILKQINLSYESFLKDKDWYSQYKDFTSNSDRVSDKLESKFNSFYKNNGLERIMQDYYYKYEPKK